MKRQPHREEFKCLWWSVIFLVMVFPAGIHSKVTYYHDIFLKENPLSLKQKKKKENKTTNKEKRHFLQEHHLYLANYFVNGGAREQDQTLLYQYIRINQNSIWWMLGIFEMLYCFASDALINNQKVKLTGVWCILIQYWSMKDLYTCLCSSLGVVQSASAAVLGKVNDRAMSVQD